MSEAQLPQEALSPRDRARIAAAASASLRALTPDGLASRPVLVGFDGFVDSITRLVDRRRTMRHDDFEPIRTIEALAARIGRAAGLSANIERVTLEDRFGGNGPLMAGAIARLGAPVDYIGAVGAAATGGGNGEVLPVFAPFAERCRRVIAIGPPSHTVCLEFDDGKVMMNDTAAVQDVTWERLVGAVGLGRLTAMVGEARLLGIVNWSLLGGVPGIWQGLIDHVLPRIASAERRLFIDLSDPAKRSDEDIAGMLAMLQRLESAGLRVTLGLNLSEATRIATVAGAHLPARGNPAQIVKCAVSLRERLGISTVVVHPRDGAAAADASGANAWFDGPFTVAPRLSTGAGDHFNGGFAFAQLHGFPLEQCLAVGCGVSGAYVRDAASPERGRLADFLADLPTPEPRPESA